jgi:hypothetical protein
MCKRERARQVEPVSIYLHLEGPTCEHATLLACFPTRGSLLAQTQGVLVQPAEALLTDHSRGR